MSVQSSGRAGASTGLSPLQSNSPRAGIVAASGIVVAYGLATRCGCVVAVAVEAAAPLVKPSNPRPITIPRATRAPHRDMTLIAPLFIGFPLVTTTSSDPTDADPLTAKSTLRAVR